MSTHDPLASLTPPDASKESSHVFTTRAEARRYVRNVLASMIDNELAIFRESAEGWFMGDVHDPETRKLITEAARELRNRLLESSR